MVRKNTKLNIGSGPSGLSTWLNYDYGILPLISKLSFLRELFIKLGFIPKNYSIKWPNIKLVNIRKKFPLADQSVEYIYCSHVLEHFERWETLKILQECKRVLVKNGIMRLIIPDIAKMLRLYLLSMNKKNNKSDRPARLLCRMWWGFDKDDEPKNFIQRLSRRFIRDHQWHYDTNELILLLKEAGFGKIILRDFRKGKVPDISKLDLESHRDHSIYIEVMK